MKKKHGTTQYRLNSAKDYANLLVEDVHNVELMWQLSDKGVVEEKQADDYIRRVLDDLEGKIESFKSYILYREDMAE